MSYQPTLEWPRLAMLTASKRELIVDHTTYFVVEPSENVSYSLAGLFNSTLVRAYMQSFAAKARGGWFRHFSWSVGMIPLPANVDRLGSSSRKAHEFAEGGDEGGLKSIQTSLDVQVRKLYGLSKDKFDAVSGYHKRMTPLLEKVTSDDDSEDEE